MPELEAVGASYTRYIIFNWADGPASTRDHELTMLNYKPVAFRIALFKSFTVAQLEHLMQGTLLFTGHTVQRLPATVSLPCFTTRCCQAAGVTGYSTTLRVGVVELVW
ncbi:hypothetical protein U1Q18_052158 [Sarracenia purpurea var. burkii]